MVQRSPHDSQSHKEVEPEDFGVVLVEGLVSLCFPGRGPESVTEGLINVHARFINFKG